MEDLVECMIIERLARLNGLVEQELIEERNYNKAVVSLLDGMLALLY